MLRGVVQATAFRAWSCLCVLHACRLAQMPADQHKRNHNQQLALTLLVRAGWCGVCDYCGVRRGDAPDRPSAPRVCPREAWPCRYRQAASRGGRNASPRRCASFTASFLRSARSLSTASSAAPAACQFYNALHRAWPVVNWTLAASADAAGASGLLSAHASGVCRRVYNRSERARE